MLANLHLGYAVTRKPYTVSNASHNREKDATWIYDWADQCTLSKIDQSILTFGTPVLIFGDYNYGEAPLWKRIADDPAATAISPAETENALNQHLATIETKARTRRPANTSPDIPAAAVAALPN